MTVDLVLLSRVCFRDREISGARLRGLIALLAGDLRTGCGTRRLIEALWPGDQPEHPAKALQILVSRARSQFGADVIVRTPTGYRLTLTEDRVDSAAVLVRAAAAARCARAGDHAAALAHADAGLAFWPDQKPRAGDGSGDPLAVLRAERQATHRDLVRLRALALARLGRAAEAVEPLTALADGLPRDEELLLELLRCEAATAGPAAALARYDAHRRALRDDLGADPGPALQEEHRRLLQGAVPTIRHGVVHEPNPLLGRDADLATVESLLRTSRVVSVVGPGGLGKTRLAHTVARRAETPAVTFVALAGISAAAEVSAEVAAALGAGDSPRGHLTPLAGAAAVLAKGPHLLVLDNCEHVVEAVAELVANLVAMTGEPRILITSRTPLGLSSEVVHHLPELSPATSAELFAQRARAARPGADLPPAAVAELCRHLDGLPLAIELAAARVRIMSVPELARRLNDRFGLLRGGARDAPARHHTLHAVVDWSWNLLDPAGQAAMRALSVFPDGFTVAAAGWILGTGPPALDGSAAGWADRVEPLLVLERLVDHSLLKVFDTPSGSRLRMLETVREFSAARLAESGQTEEATAAFLVWVRAFGLEHHATMFGPEPYQAAAAVQAEQENLLHALRLAVGRDDRATIAAVTAVLGGLWLIDSDYARLAGLVRQVSWPLSHFRPEPGFAEITRGALVVSLASAFGSDGPRPVRAVVALRRLGPAPVDSVVGVVGRVMGALGDPVELERLCAGPDPLPAGAAGILAAYHWEGAGDLDAALTAARRALGRFTGLKVPWLLAVGHCRIAELCLQREQGAEARAHLLAAIPITDRLGARKTAAGIRAWLILANLQTGDTVEAERWLDALARITFDEEPDAWSVGYELGIRAELHLARGEVEAGLRLWRRVADRVRDDILDPWVIEARAVTVVAHARHGRLDRVADLAAALPARLTRLLTHPLVDPPPYLVEQALCGTLLLAVGATRLTTSGANDGGAAPRAGVRMIALAERFRFLRNFQPTMSAAAARADAERADRAAYEEAVSSYATLDAGGLRAAALALLD
ncbi:AfsR/SARP family transcriptional regulator [Actinoplanes utahensis]|uniref:LuxR family transcriptional regulator n=1 Tax=Actinoplanes utahensis TaxID=1869 RepID=A0A0A6UR97_ACTUT|nr:BTAD domain-containing putative transcriptional regulator [Actinoplanes utahensis]KHD76929.1 LuxR family transcriptional regulator [Actinoplanes utahensis]GIF27309.1 hypothetical protein Aut01nite_02950 [Actinoplanes utahensis]